jgi:hypothetical protein
MPESDEKDYESPVFEEALPSSTNNTDKRPVYEPIDYRDNDIASEEEVPLPHSQRAPKWFPEGQSTRNVAKMVNVNKANMSDTEPCVVLTRQINVGKIKKNPSSPLSRTKNARSGTHMTADQRALQALYVWRVKKGKWGTERPNDGPLRPPKTGPSAGENDVSSDSRDSQPCSLQAHYHVVSKKPMETSTARRESPGM